MTHAHAPGPRTARTFAGCLAALWGLTILAALVVAATPALAADVRDMLALPLTATSGSAGEALDILTTNARVLGAIALAALSVRHARPLAPALDLLVLALAAGNAALVGAAIGAYGPQAVPWLAHLPLEWAALATALTGYHQARRPAPLRARTGSVLVALTATLLTAGALVESFSITALVDRHHASEVGRSKRYQRAASPLLSPETPSRKRQDADVGGSRKMAEVPVVVLTGTSKEPHCQRRSTYSRRFIAQARSAQPLRRRPGALGRRGGAPGPPGGDPVKRRGPKMVDLGALVALLGPALPFLTRTGEHVVTQASQALGQGVWEHARRLWDRLADAVAARPAAREAAEDVAANPEDAEARVVLRRQLRKILESDPARAAEVEQLLGEARQAGVVASGARSVAFEGNVSDSAIVTGDNARVERR